MIGIVGATYDAQYAADGLGLMTTPPVTARRLSATGTPQHRDPTGTPTQRIADVVPGRRDAT